MHREKLSKKIIDSDLITVVHLNPRKIALALGLFSIFLALISLFGQSLKYWTDYEYAYGLVPLFDIGRTKSIPTLYSVLLLAILGLLSTIISLIKYKKEDIFRRQWIFLAIIFFYMSLTKGTYVHNYVIRPILRILRNGLQSLPINRLSLTVSIFILVFLVFYIRFLFSLPKKTQKLVLISAAVYLIGFWSQQILGVYAADVLGAENLIYKIIAAIGKNLEMSGMVLLIYTFGDYLERYYSIVSFHL